MELRLVGAEGVRKGSLLSVKVGGKRSFVPFDEEALAKALCRFPGAGPQQVKLDVYEHVGQARLLAEAKEAQWAVGLAPPGHTARGDDGLHGSPDASIFLELEIRAAAAQESAAAPPRGDGGGGGAERRHQAALLAAKSQPYFEQHNLMPVMQTLLQSVIKETPADPYAYMIQVLQNTSRCAASRAPGRAARPSTAQACRRPPTGEVGPQRVRPRSAVARMPSTAAPPQAVPVPEDTAAGEAPAVCGPTPTLAFATQLPQAQPVALLTHRQPSPLPAMISPRQPSAPISPAGSKQASPRAGPLSAPWLGGPRSPLRPAAPEPPQRCPASSSACPALAAAPEERAQRPHSHRSLYRAASTGSLQRRAPVEEPASWRAADGEASDVLERHGQGDAAPHPILRQQRQRPQKHRAPACVVSFGSSRAEEDDAEALSSRQAPQVEEAVARTACRMLAHTQSAPSLHMPCLLPPTAGEGQLPAVSEGWSHLEEEPSRAPHARQAEERSPPVLGFTVSARHASSTSLAVSPGLTGLMEASEQPFRYGDLREVSGISSVHDSPR